MEELTDQGGPARAALAAWQFGDVSALLELLDPDVELLWWTPGQWDCHGRQQVTELLTERGSAGPPAEVDLTYPTPSTVLVERCQVVLEGPEAGFRPATLVRLRKGLVVQMRHYRSGEDAVAALAISAN